MTTSRRPTDLTHLKPGSDPTKLINDLYAHGRTYPREKPAEWPARPAVNDAIARQGRHVSRNDPFNENTNQHPENFKAPNYQNDCSGWVRGAPNGQKPTGNNSDATRLHFDRGGSWRRPDGGNDWHSGSQHRLDKSPKPFKPEKNKP
jgi:hypothetical protein